MAIRITTQDILSLHPKGVYCDTDADYARVGNRILHQFERVNVLDISQQEIKEFAITLTLYFEDVVSELGIWRSFIEWNKNKYGKYIPYYDYDDTSYFIDAPNLQDCQYLVWLSLSKIRPNGIHYPYNKLSNEFAELAYIVMIEEFEKVYINDTLQDYFKEAPFATDFFKQRDLLKWLYLSCYLTHFTSNDEVLADTEEEWRNLVNQHSYYEAECTVIYSKKTGPLYLLAQDYLSMICSFHKKKKISKTIASQEYRYYTIYKVLQTNGNKVTLLSPSNEEINVPKYNLNISPTTEMEEYYACSLVKYNDEWNLNGVSTSLTQSQPFEEMKKREQQRTLVQKVPEYKHLMELTGGNPLLYFKNRKEYTEFCIKELKLPKTMADNIDCSLSSNYDANEDIVMYVESETSPQCMAFDIARCIKDDRNPLYNKEYAKKNFTKIFTNLPEELLFYLIKHNMIPDVSFFTYPNDGIDGNKLMQDNLDITARTWYAISCTE